MSVENMSKYIWAIGQFRVILHDDYEYERQNWGRRPHIMLETK